MLSRSKRSDALTGAGENTTKDVGIYEVPGSIDVVKPSYSGFSSSSERKIFNPDHGKGTQGPGPGLYNTSVNMMQAVAPGAAEFRSKTNRWQSAEDWRPGPSGFNPSSFKKAMKSKSIKKRSDDAFAYVEQLPHKMAVPSIPVRQQSYGYEEDDAGKLIPQAPINPGFTGTKGDTVGPGDYDPVIPRSKSAINFGRGAKRPDPAAARPGAADIPGPGYYNLGSDFGAADDGNVYSEGNYMLQLKHSKSQPSASFRSGTRRDSIIPARILKEKRPGPGAYHIPGAFANVASKREDLQCFNSGEERFKSEQARSTIIMVPPTRYKPITSSFDQSKLAILKRKRMAARSTWAMGVSFESTEARFRNSTTEKKIVPPPGAYVPKDTLADDVRRKTKGKSPWDAVYKQTNRLTAKPPPIYRTDPEIMLDNKALEPEGFKPLNEWKPKNHGLTHKPKPSLPFASAVVRLARPEDTLAYGPGPGTYNTAPDWKLKNSFRMFEPTKMKVTKIPEKSPGPGSYVVDKYGLSGPPSKRKNRTNVMVSSGERFSIKQYEKDGPGPAAYNVSKSMLVPSHNVMLQ